MAHFLEKALCHIFGCMYYSSKGCKLLVPVPR